MDHPRHLVIGLGNRFRGDDAAGLLAAEAVQAKALPRVRAVAGVSDGASLIALWMGHDNCYVVDCTVSGAPPGSVRRFEIGVDSLPEHLFSTFSTHAISVSQAVALARELGQLPRRLIVYGVEGSCFETGRPPGSEVLRGVEEVAVSIAADLLRVLPESAVSLPHKKTARR